MQDQRELKEIEIQLTLIHIKHLQAGWRGDDYTRLLP